MSYIVYTQNLIFVPFFFAGFLFGLHSFYRGFICFRKKRVIENIPRSKIRSIAMGLVEVYGGVISHADTVLVSPFSRRDCVYYRYEIEEYQENGNKSRWVMVDKGESGIPFLLRDETDSVLVDPKGAEAEIPLDYKGSSGGDCDPPESVKEFMISRGLSPMDAYGRNRRLKFREYCIEPGDRLYVLGTAKDNPFMEETRSESNVMDVMIGKGDGEIYYISDRPESEILGELNVHSLFGIYGGAVLAIICLLIMATITATSIRPA